MACISPVACPFSMLRSRPGDELIKRTNTTQISLQTQQRCVSDLPQRINRQTEEDYRREAWNSNEMFEHFRSEAVVRFRVEREKRQKWELGLLSCAIFVVVG